MSHPFLIGTLDQVRGRAQRAVALPSGLRTRADLIDALGERLPLPDYWSDNWDALNDFLNDLYWITEERVILYHPDVPPTDSLRDRGIYVDILKDAVARWHEEGLSKLMAAFDPSCEAELAEALRSYPG